MNLRPAIAHRRPALLQGQAALLVLVFVASQVGSYVHAAFENHARCPEHGELIHVDELPRTAAEVVAAGDNDALLDASGDEDDHAHEHCYLCPASRDRAASSQVAHGIAASMPAVAIHAPDTAAAPGGLATYVIAPKTSPPV